MGDFQAQYEALVSEYDAIDANSETQDNAKGVSHPRTSRPQKLLEIQSKLAQLCVSHGDWCRALDHYGRILSWIEAHPTALDGQSEVVSPQQEVEPPHPQQEEEPTVAADKGAILPPELVSILPELKINTLANTAIVHHRLGDPKIAMTYLMDAKKAMQQIQANPMDIEPTAIRSKRLKALELSLTANYSVLLQCQGVINDATTVAESVVMDLTGPLSSQSSKKKEKRASDAVYDTTTSGPARISAMGVLASCMRTKGDLRQAHELSFQAVQVLQSMKKKDPVLTARMHNNLGLHYYTSRDFTTALSHFGAAYQVSLRGHPVDSKLQAIIQYHLGLTLAELGTTVAISPVSKGESTTGAGVDAHACFTQSEQLVTHSLDPLDQKLAIAAQICQGELAYTRGDFTQAHLDLETARIKLEAFHPSEPEQTPAVADADEELVKLQGRVDSCLGCVLLVRGKFELAEEAHQRDLELALSSEDIHAQLRALRNLAVLYGTTQRYHEAITLWRETIEISVVLSSKPDLMVGYSGLGSALHELKIADSLNREFDEMLSLDENDPRRVLVKARALAMELGDGTHQILAQRALVATYEWQPQSGELEQRLEESDALVRLCEVHDLFTADGYRSLANAITAQISRLAERGQRFAEAIQVLKFKRNSILQKFKDASSMTASPQDAGNKPIRMMRPFHTRHDVVLRL